MGNLEKLQNEIGGVNAYLGMNSQGEEYEANTLSIEQVKKFAKTNDSSIVPEEFDSLLEFTALIERVVDTWTYSWAQVTPRFGGSIEDGGYIDTVYFIYDSLYGHGLTGRQHRDFEEFVVKRFKLELSLNPEDNYGVCPICTDGIIRKNIIDDTVLRDAERDEKLWATPDTLMFDEYDEWGLTAHLEWVEER